MLLPRAWHYALLALLACTLVIGACALAQWQEERKATTLRTRNAVLEKQIHDYSQSSRLHKRYLERLLPTSLSEGMNLADKWVGASGGRLLRLERLAGEANSFRLEARFEPEDLYAWLATIDSRRVLLDGLMLERDDESLLLRAIHRTP